MTPNAAPASPGDNSVHWRVLARGVATLHVAYVVFVVFGALLVLLWRPLMWVHLAAVVWAIATMGFDLGCPLTPWEKTAWTRGGRVPYDEGFLQHHVLRTTFDPAKSRRNHVMLAVFVVVLNVIIYWVILRR
jgi:hypothetical protein